MYHKDKVTHLKEEFKNSLLNAKYMAPEIKFDIIKPFPMKPLVWLNFGASKGMLSSSPKNNISFKRSNYRKVVNIKSNKTTIYQRIGATVENTKNNEKYKYIKSWKNNFKKHSRSISNSHKLFDKSAIKCKNKTVYSRETSENTRKYIKDSK